MTAFLEKILKHKQQEIVALKKKRALSSLRSETEKIRSNPRSFKQALERTISNQKTALIAEIKQASPSAGILKGSMGSGSMGSE